MTTTAPSFGYTLIEVLVVLAILGIITSFAVPMGGNLLDHVALQTDSRALVSQIRALEQEAVDKEETIVIEENADRTGISASSTGAIALPSGSSVQFDDTAHRILLFPDGTTTGARVRLSKGDRSYVIGIAWLTGNLSLEASK